MNEIGNSVDSTIRESLKRDPTVLAELFQSYRDRLRRIIAARLDKRLSARIDPEDVIQEVYIDVAERVQFFLDDPSFSFFVWVRLVCLQTLSNIHRRHFSARKRDVSKEKSISVQNSFFDESVNLACQLIGKLTSPSEALVKKELSAKMEKAISFLSDSDREILELRHFEQLSNTEAAEILGIKTKAASMRYIRALERLREIASDVLNEFFNCSK